MHDGQLTRIIACIIGAMFGLGFAIAGDSPLENGLDVAGAAAAVVLVSGTVARVVSRRLQLQVDGAGCTGTRGLAA
ncbi:MAG: hypothetical protein OXG42_08030 [Chloroflexi bacterium]|nr:hypothetical protein [Chloroflexota bacterium]